MAMAMRETETKRLTADEIATMFARGKRDGHWNLTKKQTDWLGGVAQREAWRQGCKTEQRRFDGFLLDSQGHPNGARWSLSIYRNGAGLFQLDDTAARLADQAATKQSERLQLQAVLAEMDERLDSGNIGSGWTPGAWLDARNLFARHNGLPMRESV